MNKNPLNDEYVDDEADLMACGSALGADPLNMNFPEVFTALQQGSIDGQETPIDVTYSSGEVYGSC